MLSIALHILILLFFFYSLEKVKWISPQRKEEKITLNLSQFIPPSSSQKPVVKTTNAKEKHPLKPIIKTSTPAVKRKSLHEKKQVLVTKRAMKKNNHTKVIYKKKFTKKRLKKHPIKKRVAKRSKHKKRQKRYKDPLANMLMGSSKSMHTTQKSYAPRSRVRSMIKQLYGKSFKHFTPSQKEFIKKNVGAIQRITQRVLIQNGYPTVSIQTKQQGINIVTFYLHPNGDISGLRLKKRMGYAALDKNTLEVIRIAYKDYPLPKSKTKIIFYVKYQLY